jgi:hypothetical protein
MYCLDQTLRIVRLVSHHYLLIILIFKTITLRGLFDICCRYQHASLGARRNGDGEAVIVKSTMMMWLAKVRSQSLVHSGYRPAIAAHQQGPVSAVGKLVGTMIERTLVLNADWTVAIFWASLPSAGSLMSERESLVWHAVVQICFLGRSDSIRVRSES